MVVVTERLRHVQPSDIAALARDTIRLTWEQRRWTRRRLVTTGGREVAVALPTGSVLHPGDIVAIEPQWYLQIEAEPEPVIAVHPRDRADAIRVAFEVGNRHFSIAIDGNALLVPDDPAMEQLLTRLGSRWERRCAVYCPLGGEADADVGAHRHG